LWVVDLRKAIEGAKPALPPCHGELCYRTLTPVSINDLGQIVLRFAVKPYAYEDEADLMLLTPVPQPQ
jgi:hypothetical protein